MYAKEKNKLFVYKNRILLELTKLKMNIDFKKGAVFVRHVYTKEQLLESPEIEKVMKITELLSSNLDSWEEHGGKNRELRDEIQQIYSYIEDTLNEIIGLIETRKSTRWETVKKGLLAFKDLVISVSPRFIRKLLSTYIVSGYLTSWKG